VFLFYVLLSACELPGARAPEAPTHVRVGILPDESEPRLRERFEPLLDYLGSTTGLEVELYVSEDYDALLDAFDSNALDLVRFGGLTFVQARQRSNAQPLVSRDIDVHFTTLFVVASDTKGHSIEAFAGESLAFGPRLSTSGHLMARAFLETRGIRPEAFFESVRYSGGHDETLAWVRDGVVTIGAVNGQMAQGVMRDSGEVRVVATPPPYQNYVWATPGTLDTRVHEALLAAFLALDPAVPEHAALLVKLDAGGFLPVGTEAYAALQRTAREAGLLEDGR
jgi:phosphonate transport system substrate-binding protein